MRITVPTAFLALLFLLGGCSAIGESMGYATEDSRQEYIEKNDPADYVADAIREGRVVEGMTMEEVEAALGSPTDYNRTSGGTGEQMQLVYEATTSQVNRAYVYLEEGDYGTLEVTSWQNVCKVPRFCVE